MQRKLAARFRPLFAGAFFQGFVLWYAIEKLFMTKIGFTDASITVETAILTVVMVVANIPLGVLADRWSRKGVLMLASLALMANSAICGLSHGFLAYTLGACFWAFFYACYTGAYDSIVYDTLLEEVGDVEKFEHYYGRIQFFDSLALVIGSLLSAAAIHFISLRAIYFMTIPFTGASLFAIAAFHEPTLHHKSRDTLLGAHLKATFRAILGNRNIFWVAASIVLIGVVMRIMFEFDQLWLIALALPVTFYGPINALMLSGVGVSGLLAARIKNSPAMPLALSFAVVAASFVLLGHARVAIISAQIILLATLLLLSIVLGRYLHDALPSAVRAGASSVVGTLGYLFFVPIALVFGAISRHASVFRGAWVVVVLAAATSLSVVIVMISRRHGQLAKRDVS